MNLRHILNNLTLLSVKSGINELLKEDFTEIINLLEPLNIEARYPTHKKQLLSSLTKTKCKEILLKTKEFTEMGKREVIKKLRLYKILVSGHFDLDKLILIWILCQRYTKN